PRPVTGRPVAGSGDDHTSGRRITPWVGLPLPTALVLDHRGDVSDAHLERERIGLVHAAQLLHEAEHVLHGLLREALHADEPPVAGLGKTGHATRFHSVEVTHDRPPAHCRQTHGSEAGVSIMANAALRWGTGGRRTPARQGRVYGRTSPAAPWRGRCCDLRGAERARPAVPCRRGP